MIDAAHWVNSCLEKTLPGLGELSRFLSYQEIDSRAVQQHLLRKIDPKVVAEIDQQKLIFCLPGFSNAVKLGLTQLILPELVHLVQGTPSFSGRVPWTSSNS